VSVPGAALSDLDIFLELENQVWAALMAGDRSADERLLAEAFLGVYPSGHASKADHVGQLAAGAVVSHYRLSEAKLLPLGEDQALLSYRADWQRVSAQTEMEEAMYVSSLWRRMSDGRWENLFSQDTPCAISEVSASASVSRE